MTICICGNNFLQLFLIIKIMFPELKCFQLRSLLTSRDGGEGGDLHQGPDQGRQEDSLLALDRDCQDPRDKTET